VKGDSGDAQGAASLLELGGAVAAPHGAKVREQGADARKLT
jgi:hypothetical protein